ncbi:di-trans,poly-cis-decaprenylcistransferase [Candidatus Woesearchaeota archaeon]|nr:di-trans,poly-cis-decaprenylcistransferase [Candidatus Woesearchaeota archaeon]
MPSPKHIGIILDGNRRFAKRLMLKPWKGHEWGAKKVEALLDWCSELGIKELTLYAFSLENFNRPKEEFDYIMKVFKSEFEAATKDERFEKRGIRVRFIGRIELFPEDVQKSMKSLMERTKNNTNYTVNFAMAYGGRAEIVDAARRIVKDVESGKLKAEIDEKLFSKYLYMEDEPEMIIRTGGDKRLSNFLLYQCSYSELFFIEKLWPEFEKEDLVKCIKEFGERERRFGK